MRVFAWLCLKMLYIVYLCRLCVCVCVYCSSTVVQSSGRASVCFTAEGLHSNIYEACVSLCESLSSCSPWSTSYNTGEVTHTVILCRTLAATQYNIHISKQTQTDSGEKPRMVNRAYRQRLKWVEVNLWRGQSRQRVKKSSCVYNVWFAKSGGAAEVLSLQPSPWSLGESSYPPEGLLFRAPEPPSPWWISPRQQIKSCYCCCDNTAFRPPWGAPLRPVTELQNSPNQPQLSGSTWPDTSA